MSERLGLVITCEHAGNEIPEAYRHLFDSVQARAALETHRGYDPGALSLAEALATRFGVPLIATTISRLLVEPNRSIGHRRLFSEFTSALPDAERRTLLDRYYRSHRRSVEDAVRTAVDRDGRVLHVAVHTFTPELEGRPRTADVGLLYDPSRSAERELCARWKALVERAWPGANVRRNYPYLGKADGLTAELRRRFAPGSYLGVELEVNNARLVGPGARPERVAGAIGDSLERLLEARR